MTMYVRCALESVYIVSQDALCVCMYVCGVGGVGVGEGCFGTRNRRGVRSVVRRFDSVKGLGADKG